MNTATNTCPIESFNQINLPTVLLNTLNQLNYTKPTPIQAQTIPLALEKHDILGSAQTGTGKTLAFTIPLIANLLNDHNQTGLILTPTRELAEQIITVIKKILGNKSSIKIALLIGGQPIFKQFKQLKQNPRIIVGTPGRIIDHLNRKSLSPKCNFLVLDETDRMFDMGFGIQLDAIMKQLPINKQTLMFSATLPKNIEKLAISHLNQPKRIAIEPVTDLIPKLKEETIKLKETEKFNTLLNQISNRNGTIIIFVKTKHGAEILSKDLNKNNHKVSYIHGDLKQSKRYKVMQDFRNGCYKIMVATDIAARGLDVPHIEHVINYDLPSCPEDYVHRIGRTARAGAEGSALNLVSFKEQYKWDAIQRFIDPEKAEKPKKSSPHTFKKRNFNSNRDQKNYFSTSNYTAKPKAQRNSLESKRTNNQNRNKNFAVKFKSKFNYKDK